MQIITNGPPTPRFKLLPTDLFVFRHPRRNDHAVVDDWQNESRETMWRGEVIGDRGREKKKNGMWLEGASARLFVFIWGMGKNLKGRKRKYYFFTTSCFPPFLEKGKRSERDEQEKKGNRKTRETRKKTKQNLLIQLALRFQGLRSDGESGVHFLLFDVLFCLFLVVLFSLFCVLSPNVCADSFPPFFVHFFSP